MNAELAQKIADAVVADGEECITSITCDWGDWGGQ